MAARGRRWTDDELTMMRDTSLSTTALAKKLKRSPGSVAAKRSQFGIYAGNGTAKSTPAQDGRAKADAGIVEMMDEIQVRVNELESQIEKLEEEKEELDEEIQRLDNLRNDL